MSVKRSGLRAPQTLVVVVEPPPLGPAEQRFVRDALCDIAAEWTVDLHGFCADEANLILVPEGGEDAFGPSFVISREGFRYRLDQVHWDEMHEMGHYPALADVVAAIRNRLNCNDIVTKSIAGRRH